jgi:hypothetical protein
MIFSLTKNKFYGKTKKNKFKNKKATPAINVESVENKIDISSGIANSDNTSQEVDTRETIKILRTNHCRPEISIGKVYNFDTGFYLQANLEGELDFRIRSKNEN